MAQRSATWPEAYMAVCVTLHLVRTCVGGSMFKSNNDTARAFAVVPAVDRANFERPA